MNATILNSLVILIKYIHTLRKSDDVLNSVHEYFFGDHENPIARRRYALKNFLQPVHGKIRHTFESWHLDVTKANWDNLVVLDACRADLFEEVVDTDQFDEYRRVRSKASNTSPWTYRTFNESYTGETYGDIVYVSANPVTSHEAPNAFYRLVEACDGAFDEETHAIPSEPVAEQALMAHEANPNKRLIVHFVQPHLPFVKTPELIFRTHWRPEIDFKNDEDAPEKEPPRSVWEALEMGVVDREAVWDGYKQNLAYGFENAMDLVEELPGRTVITSDHGNLLGERGLLTPISIYAHPQDLRSPEHVKVPWAVFEGDERRDVVDEGAKSQPATNNEEIKARLHDLGYVG
jgi:hypothetical protein